MNSDKLNYIIKKKSNGNNNITHHLHQMFFFECVLRRIEVSKYKNNIILKGGVLLSSIIGEDLRTTKDIDTTLKSVQLNKTNIQNIFNEILAIDINDNVLFKIENIKDIRDEDEYGGFRINVKGEFDKIKTNFFLEVTTGDIITPKEIMYKYNSIFDSDEIKILAYNIETIIAEKFESIVSKNITTTRAKDFYDIYMLLNSDANIKDINLLLAIKNTFNKRNTLFCIREFKEIIEIIKESDKLRKVHNDYQLKLEYTHNVSFEDTVDALEKIVNILERMNVSV